MESVRMIYQASLHFDIKKSKYKKNEQLYCDEYNMVSTLFTSSEFLQDKDLAEVVPKAHR